MSELRSTEINSHAVVFARVETRYPQFGVKEYEYEVNKTALMVGAKHTIFTCNQNSSLMIPIF